MMKRLRNFAIGGLAALALSGCGSNTSKWSAQIYMGNIPELGNVTVDTTRDLRTLERTMRVVTDKEIVYFVDKDGDGATDRITFADKDFPRNQTYLERDSGRMFKEYDAMRKRINESINDGKLTKTYDKTTDRD